MACYDIGEFVRFHPRGKKYNLSLFPEQPFFSDGLLLIPLSRSLIQALDAKVPIMNLMTHPDPAVQKEALLCVQKLMVHNWEYLSR